MGNYEVILKNKILKEGGEIGWQQETIIKQ